MEYISLKQSEFFKVHFGISIPINDDQYWGDKIAYVTPADLSQRNGVTLINQTKKMLSNTGIEKAKNRISAINTILIQRQGALDPKIGLLKIPALVSHYLMAINVVDEKVIYPDYVAIMLDTSREQIGHFSSGNAAPFFKRDVLLSMQIPLISKEEQERLISQNQNSL